MASQKGWKSRYSADTASMPPPGKKIKKEADMEVKELVEFMCKESKAGEEPVRIMIEYDGGGFLQHNWTGMAWQTVTTFHNLAELERWVEKFSKKPPDYKSLFSVVDGCLVADFSGIEITEENCLPLSWTKWVVRGEMMNETGKIIVSYPLEGDSCACCELYPNCINCPIALFSGRTGCHNTPYDAFEKARKKNDLFAAMIANRKEEEFLKSLMEKKPDFKLITRKQFNDLCSRDGVFKVVKWPDHRNEMYLSEFARMARDVNMDDFDVQYVIWEFDESGWKNARNADSTIHVDNYLNE